MSRNTEPTQGFDSGSFDPAPNSEAVAASSSTGEREMKLRLVVREVARRFSEGTNVDRERLLTEHAELLPELEEELRLQEITHREFLAAQRAGPVDVTAPGPVEAPFSVQGYRIVSEISHGGQGTVFRAVHIPTGRTVALKVLAGGSLLASRRQARLDREAAILAQLQHPNIVSILDRGRTSDGSSYLTMDYIDGADLDQWIGGGEGGGLRRVEDVLRVFIKICEAVGAAHALGIVHRDIKPSNVRIDQRGEPHLLDFGLARILADEAAPTAARTTATGQMVGSLPWLSPEQASGLVSDVDAHSDVYSLGVMLYESLTGQAPYSREGSLAQILLRVQHAVPLAPSRLRAGLPRTIDRVVLKSLAKSTAGRYASASEMARDLRACADGTAIDGANATKRLVQILGLAALLAIGAIVVVAVQHNSKPRLPASTASLVPPAAAAGELITLRPVQDAYVRDGEYSERTLGNEASETAQSFRKLEVKTIAGTIGYNRDSYLQFDLSQIPPGDRITQGVLKLYGLAQPGVMAEHKSATPVTVYAYALQDPKASWDEATIKWNNRPFIFGWQDVKLTKGSVSLKLGETGWHEIDLTSFLQAEREAGRNLVTVSLHIKDSVDHTVFFDSSEGAKPPKLEVRHLKQLPK